MPIPQKLIKFLEKNKVKYEPIKHRTVYTAYDKAQTLRFSQKMIGKTLVLKVDKNIVIILISANKNLDKNKFKKIAKTLPTSRQVKKVDFVSERIIKNKLKGMKVGAIPPFGNLWRLPTFIDKSLLAQPKIIVNGGDYNWSIKISPANLKKLIPDLVIGNFSKSRSR
jgi:Ala-tRNA(Pro) deacylase